MLYQIYPENYNLSVKIFEKLLQIILNSEENRRYSVFCLSSTHQPPFPSLFYRKLFLAHAGGFNHAETDPNPLNKHQKQQKKLYFQDKIKIKGCGVVCSTRKTRDCTKKSNYFCSQIKC